MMWLSLLRSQWLRTGILVLALGLSVAWGKAGWRNAHQWKSAYQAQEAATRAVSEAAKAKAERARIETENRYALLAAKADADSAALDRLRSASRSFAMSRSLRAYCGNAPGGTPAPGQGGPAPSDTGPGADAVVVTRPEYEQFVANSIRLEQVRQWGESLVREGLAVPEVEFAPE